VLPEIGAEARREEFSLGIRAAGGFSGVGLFFKGGENSETRLSAAALVSGGPVEINAAGRMGALPEIGAEARLEEFSPGTRAAGASSGAGLFFQVEDDSNTRLSAAAQASPLTRRTPARAHMMAIFRIFEHSETENLIDELLKSKFSLGTRFGPHVRPIGREDKNSCLSPGLA
jgi:hypothetical protein